MKLKIATVLLSLATVLQVHSQEILQKNDLKKRNPKVAIKTNLLYDATTTLNLGAEFRLGRKTSLDIPVSYNPWTFSGNKKWKHILVQPEFRRWKNETFKGSFWGLHAHYAFYNVGALDNPPFSEYMSQHRFEGWLAGAGISYGYRWNLNHRWAMEATAGVGYAYLSYDKYPCHTCGEKIGSETKNYFGPTKAGISLIYTFGGKKKAVSEVIPGIIPVREPEPAPRTLYEPRLEASFIVPEVEVVKKRCETDKAYLDFSVGKSVILPDFRNNPQELAKIYRLIESVSDNSETVITGISIFGYASPEGTYQSNLILSQKRANALKEHLKSVYGLKDSLFYVEGKGEDWEVLDSLVNQSAMPDKNRILSIIRDTGIFDGREKKLMELSGGIPYKKMLAELFPGLRRLGYELHYKVLPFTVEKGKEVLKTHPSSLSLNEMFLIAQTYKKGSDEFYEVFDTAARIFPASDIANLNAGANALNRKDTVSAAGYLDKVQTQSAAYFNNKGVLSFLEGDKEKASEYFIKAQAAGNPEATGNAEEMDKHLESIR